MKQKHMYTTTILSMLITILMIGCSRQSAQVVTSPDGALKVRTEITGPAAGPTKRYCVMLIFENTEGKESRMNTAASDAMKWAIDWHDDDTLILYSSDIGTYAYDVGEGMKISKRKPNEEEMNTGRKAYKNKYGSAPPTPGPD